MSDALWETDEEKPRDQTESGFTPILRALFRRASCVAAVVFVDSEGECVDYCSGLPPYDAKVVGAHLTLVLSEIRRPIERLLAGDILDFAIYGDGRDLLFRRVSDEYAVAVVTAAGGMTDDILDAVDEMVAAIRREIHESPPFWDVRAAPIHVDVRESVSWPFAPAMVRRGSEETAVIDVIGRWEEQAKLPVGQVVCFRVRMERMGELTLAFDANQARWFAW